jgi:hypothetical protein
MHDLVKQDNIIINTKFKQLFNKIFNLKPTDHKIETDNEYLTKINSKIKNNNYYKLDKYGLVIRTNEVNKKKTIFGYIMNEDNEYINIHINNLLISFNSKELILHTLQLFKNNHKKEFKQNSIIYKLYNNLYPDIMEKI